MQISILLTHVISFLRGKNNVGLMYGTIEREKNLLKPLTTFFFFFWSSPISIIFVLSSKINDRPC